MYRIELGPDDVGVFRSIEELATAIKTGVITSKARIYHSASDKWLPIEFHPHFKKAREMSAGPVPPAPPTPPPRVDSGIARVRTPLPAPSPMAGLPLIDVSARTPAAPPPASEPAEPAAAPQPLMPEPVAHAEPLPPYIEPAAAYVEPEPAAHLPPEPAHELEPEMEPEPVREPALALTAYSPPTPALPVMPLLPELPEPERDAIFLSVEAPTAVEEPAEFAPAGPSVVEEPAHEPHPVAAPLPGFQLPRVDLRLRERRRPLLIAAAVVTLAFTTHLALSSGPTLDLGMSVPIPDLRPKALRAERPETPSSTNASVLPASVPAKGSPSFGGASAFSTPAPIAETAAPPPRADTAAPAAVAPIAPPPKIAITAPKLGTVPSLDGDLKSASGVVARYDAAYAAARAELENGLKTAGFANLFATSRLQPDGLRAARASVGTASAYVQRYRRREAEIEQVYRDSFDLLASRNKWSDGQRRTWEARKVAKEHPEIAKLSSFLLQSLDSLYGLLAAQEAGYRLLDGSIAFDDAAAARAYAELRPWLDRRAHAWADTDADVPTTAARILRAMGSAKLPEGQGI